MNVAYTLNRAARYRSVVRLYVEALVGGVLDESLVPELARRC